MITVKVNKPKDMEAFFLKAKKDAGGTGITWSGDITKGQIVGRGIKGNYVVDTEHIIVHVTKKPPFLTKVRIEKEIVKYIST